MCREYAERLLKPPINRRKPVFAGFFLWVAGRLAVAPFLSLKGTNIIA